MRGNVFVLVSPRSDSRFPRYSPRSKGTINFFLKYPELYVRARRTLGSLARASSRSTYRKLARHVRCSLHSRHFFSFLFLLFTIAPYALQGGKKCGSRRLGPFIGANIFPCLEISGWKRGAFQRSKSLYSCIFIASYTRIYFIKV